VEQLTGALINGLALRLVFQGLLHHQSCADRKLPGPFVVALANCTFPSAAPVKNHQVRMLRIACDGLKNMQKTIFTEALRNSATLDNGFILPGQPAQTQWQFCRL
jgi:hypothetical protein